MILVLWIYFDGKVEEKNDYREDTWNERKARVLLFFGGQVLFLDWNIFSL